MRELSEGTKWIIGIAVVLLLGGLTGLQCQKQENAYHENMAKLGYQQVMVVGRANPVWQEVNDDK